MLLPFLRPPASPTAKYFVFEMSKIALAEQMFGQAQGTGAFYWTTAIKKVRATQIPESLGAAGFVTEDLAVKILETDFDEADADIEAAAKQEAMFWSASAAEVRDFLEI
jgi:hypothetical protein